jgi:hypothetical protein
MATPGITEKTALMLEGLGEGRFKLNSTCFDGEKACTAGEAVLIRPDGKRLLIEKVEPPEVRRDVGARRAA